MIASYLKYLGPALRLAFGGKAQPVNKLAKEKDAAMMAYLLDRQADMPDPVAFQMALIYATSNATLNPRDWLPIIRLIREHPAAATLTPSTIGNCLIEAAADKNFDAAAELLKFDQVAQIDEQNWDQILFYCLPKGDPEKRRIEKRAFEDKDGHPGILAMVRDAMNKEKNEKAAQRSMISSHRPSTLSGR